MKRAGARTWVRAQRAGFAAVVTLGLLIAVSPNASASPQPTSPRPTNPQPTGAGTPIPPGSTLLPPGTVVPDAAPPPKAATGTPKTFKVYATREGLTGHTTANGHKIVPNDHFVSLPSTQSLATKNGSDYSVRVCSVTNGRCAYEPVWDVGPWNTNDAYWAAKRTSWSSLPTGKPEAQAAYQDGYNGGKDQFGRKVLNPAGIDLADGTIRNGLDLSSSGWVDVTYLWTGGGVRGTISTNGGTVNIRSGDSTAHKVVGMAGPHAQIPIQCRLTSQRITRSGTTSTWYRLAKGNYISGAYVNVKSGTNIPTC
jgi:hypothetical protein